MKKLLTFLCLLIPCNAFAARISPEALKVRDLPNGVTWVIENKKLQYNNSTYGCDTEAGAKLGNNDVLYLYIHNQPLRVIRCAVVYDLFSLFITDLTDSNYSICADSDLHFSNPNVLISNDEYTVSIKQTIPNGIRFPPNSNNGIFINGCVSIKCNKNYKPDSGNNKCVPDQSIDETITEDQIKINAGTEDQDFTSTNSIEI